MNVPLGTSGFNRKKKIFFSDLGRLIVRVFLHDKGQEFTQGASGYMLSTLSPRKRRGSAQCLILSCKRENVMEPIPGVILRIWVEGLANIQSLGQGFTL